MSTITGNVIDLTGKAQTQVKAASLSRNVIAGGSIVMPGEKVVRTDEHGNFSITLPMGDYLVTIGTDTWRINSLDDNQSYPFEQRLITPPTAVPTPGSPVASQLIDWTASEAFQLTAATYDGAGNLATATVGWPDGSAGVFTVLVLSTPDRFINSFSVTHANSNRTVTQPAVTRNANGNITVKPQLVIS